jgi:hypothetical protein
MSLETKDLVAGIKRRPVLAGCAVAVLLLAGLLYFRWDLAAQLEGRLGERDKELKRLSSNVKFSAQLETHLESLRAANRRIAEAALRETERARNQQLFLSIEGETGVKLVDLVQQPVPLPARGANVPASAYVAIPFTVSVRGSYDQLFSFLHRLEHNATLVRVTSATLIRPDETGQQSLNLTMELIGFRS